VWHLLGDERLAEGHAVVAPGAGGLEGVLGTGLAVNGDNETLLRWAGRGGEYREGGR
jgi:hypothetical protein